ncbi:MAG: glycosyltransferase [Spirochaetales bacterium]|nr:glycosyltransferase [Spirochaetales bacterium]
MTENLNRITLQNILLNPVSGTSEGLYFTGSGHSLNSEGMKIVNGGFLDFYSYFNLISWKKWSDYTGVDSLSLRLELQGKCEIVISSRQITGEQKDPFSTFVEGDGITIINIPSHLLYGQLSFKIIPAVDALLISGDWISTDMPYTQNVNVAAVICTYKQNDSLFRNLELIKNNLPSDFEIIVIDNASLLGTDSIKAYGPEFHLYHNQNTGVSGGFTRGIMKAFSSHSRVSHVLFIGNDIQLEPDTIRRSISLLRHLKPEYRGHFVSGAMLLLDEPHKIFESTAGWNGFRAKSYKRGLDLIGPTGLGQLDKEESHRNQYAAWWYCAFPLSSDIRENLPFPFFLYGDDIDYSFRHAKGFLTLNGIGVWHESFYKKFNPYF